MNTTVKMTSLLCGNCGNFKDIGRYINAVGDHVWAFQVGSSILTYCPTCKCEKEWKVIMRYEIYEKMIKYD